MTWETGKKLMFMDGVGVVCVCKHVKYNPREEYRIDGNNLLNDAGEVVGFRNGCRIFIARYKCPVCGELVKEGTIAVKCKKFFHPECFKKEIIRGVERVDEAMRKLIVEGL